MTENQNAAARVEDRVRTGTQHGYGRAPVMAAGVAAAVLASLLVWGGVGAAGAMTAPRAVLSAQSTQAPPTPDPGVHTPGAEDPTTPPDRASDQNVAAQQKDTVYLIQNGDTLTSISAKLGMSVDAIAAYNAVRNVNVINAGAVLRVPFIYVPPTPAATN